MIDISKVNSRDLKDGVYKESFPEFYVLDTIVENSLWHDHQSVLDHVIGVFEGLEVILSSKEIDVGYLSEVIGHKTRRDILKIAALLHDIAKPDVAVYRSDGTVGCPGHELIAAARVRLFSQKFGLNTSDEAYVERIVRYHGFISEILNLMMETKDKEKYFQIFKETVGDVAIELILLMHADLLGSDLAKAEKQGFDARIGLLTWMLQNQA